MTCDLLKDTLYEMSRIYYIRDVQIRVPILYISCYLFYRYSICDNL